MTLFERFPRRVPPPAWFTLCLAVGWGLGRVFPWSFGVLGFGVRVGAACALFALVAALGSSALVCFRRARTTFHPFATPTALLCGGPYRFTRNPLYVALVTGLAAFALLLDEGWILACAPALALTLDRLVIPDEEAKLAELFGPAYAAYRARVRRWL
jgi:protein-S-isoprenylcysteine O-methyltransferase Ste14